MQRAFKATAIGIPERHKKLVSAYVLPNDKCFQALWLKLSTERLSKLLDTSAVKIIGKVKEVEVLGFNRGIEYHIGSLGTPTICMQPMNVIMKCPGGNVIMTCGLPPGTNGDDLPLTIRGDNCVLYVEEGSGEARVPPELVCAFCVAAPVSLAGRRCAKCTLLYP
ncbi:MAG: hypothetical protein CL678_00585 [Bdellovibrionaceae bacterium]|nr:hypothetical protein [Pseudobdellovibrionaceae bacterium]|tara:strand:+ start:529 stop:1023 length:495 start_codon:yes stop_codon:yes gene_type:complete